jgi:hypothetical protein
MGRFRLPVRHGLAIFSVRSWFWGIWSGVDLSSIFRVQGSGFRVQGSGFRVQGSGKLLTTDYGPGMVRRGRRPDLRDRGTGRHGPSGVSPRPTDRGRIRLPSSVFRLPSSVFRLPLSGSGGLVVGQFFDLTLLLPGIQVHVVVRNVLQYRVDGIVSLLLQPFEDWGQVP